MLNSILITLTFLTSITLCWSIVEITSNIFYDITDERRKIHNIAKKLFVISGIGFALTLLIFNIV
jgi:hypothetical protein